MHKRLLTSFAIITLSTILFIGCGNEQESTQQASIENVEVTATEESTAEQTADSTETQEETTEEIETATETEEVIAEEPTAEPQAVYTYTDMSATMYAQQSVNVRDLPSTDGEKVGNLSTNQEVTVTGQCNETSWYRIAYNDSVAYVSNKYLASEKKAEQVATQPSQTEQTTDYPDCPYTLFEATFDGTYFYFYHDQTHQGYFAGCDSATAILVDLVNQHYFDCPGGTEFSLDHDNVETTVMGDYKNTSPNVQGAYMTVIYVKIPLKIVTP